MEICPSVITQWSLVLLSLYLKFSHEARSIFDTIWMLYLSNSKRIRQGSRSLIGLVLWSRADVFIVWKNLIRNSSEPAGRSVRLLFFTRYLFISPCIEKMSIFAWRIFLWNTNWEEVLKFKGRNLDPLPALPTDVTDTFN